MTDETLLQTRQAELEKIRKRHGGVLNPADVVEFARNERTALHSAFTWDDTEAAREYRLWQARQVIRVCVTVRDEVKGPPIRTYVSLYEDRGENGYRLLDDVLSDEEMASRLLTQALGELNTWRAKYSQLQKLAPIFAAGEQVEADVLKMKASGGSVNRKAAADKA